MSLARLLGPIRPVLRGLTVLLRLLSAGFALYASAILGLWAVDAVWPGQVWPAAMAMLVLPWLLLPTVPGLALALLARRRVGTVVLAAAALLFATQFGPLFMPRASAEAPRKLRVATWNLGPHGQPADGLIDAIRRLDADILAIQELDGAEADLLDAELRSDYPHRSLSPWDRVGGIGKGLLSRRPIVDQDVLSITDPGRAHQMATIDVDGTHLTIFNAHPHPPPHLPYVRGDSGYREHPVTNADVAVIGAQMTATAPAILLGDLNSTPRSTAWRALRAAGLRDAFEDAGWGLGATWPSELPWSDTPWPVPVIRIDYVWHTSDMRSVHTWAGEPLGTDHRPVIADLTW